MGHPRLACQDLWVPPVHAPVLVVDDDDHLRSAVLALLEASGYDAVAVSDGRQAFDLLQRGVMPRIILLDLTMPDMDGEHFRFVQLRHERLAAIPVVIFSGRSDAKEIGRSLGTEAVLEKPVDAEALLRAVERHASQSA